MAERGSVGLFFDSSAVLQNECIDSQRTFCTVPFAAAVCIGLEGFATSPLPIGGGAAF